MFAHITTASPVIPMHAKNLLKIDRGIKETTTILKWDSVKIKAFIQSQRSLISIY